MVTPPVNGQPSKSLREAVSRAIDAISTRIVQPKSGRALSLVLSKIKEVRPSTRRGLLVTLGALGMAGMSVGVSPWGAIPLVVVLYCLDPITDLFRDWRQRMNGQRDLDSKRSHFQKYTRRKRYELSADEPELPLGNAVDQGEDEK